MNVKREEMRQRTSRSRIAFVSDTVFPYSKGGRERRLHEISTRLAHEGHEVSIYTMQWWSGAKQITLDGVKLIAISKEYSLYKGHRRSIFQALVFSAACLKLLHKRFDIVDVDHMPFFPLFSVRLVCWLRGKKMYATWHEVWGKNYWRQYIGGIGGIIGGLTERISFHLPDMIITNSYHTTEMLVAATKTKKVIYTIPLGVDVDKIDSISASKEKNDVIYVGRLVSNKNVDLLIEGISQAKDSMPSITCLIIGNGPDESALQKQVLESGLKENVKFLKGVDSDTELYSLMKAAKVFVLPSTREGFGLVVLEANACDLPVITTDHAQNASKKLIIEGKNGFAVHPGARQLAEAIKMSLDVNTLEPRRVIDNELSDYTWKNVTVKIETAFGI